MKTHLCKICSITIPEKRTYCSNTCKFSDSEYNKLRGSKLKKVKTYKWNCDRCVWGTNDEHNISGAIVKHLIAEHKISPLELYQQYPKLKISVRQKKRFLRRKSELLCKICGQSLQKITETHLKSHGLTTKEYKLKYQTNKIINADIQQKQSQVGIKHQIDQIFNGNRLSSTITPLFTESEYIGVNNHSYPFECTVCKFKFTDHLDDGNIPICRNCNPKLSLSPNGQAEQEVYDFIKSIYNGIILKNDRLIIKPKELDIVIPDLKLAIEYNGLYWHSETFLEKSYHLQKMEACNNAGYKLIQIFEDEWLKKKSIVQSKLLHLFKKTPVTIQARKCTIEKISSIDSNKFLEENHLQGSDTSNLRYGLFHKNQLISVVTFSKPRIALGQKSQTNNILELSRFCILKNTSIVGGLSRLLTYFKKENPYIGLYSYADLRYTDKNSNGYIKCKFVFSGQTKPGYWYIKPGQIKRYHRFNFTKQKTVLLGGNPLKSEWENMQNLGYSRIWDCGHAKYELTAI